MSIKLLNPELLDIFDPILLKKMNTQESLIWDLLRGLKYYIFKVNTQINN